MTGRYPGIVHATKAYLRPNVTRQFPGYAITVDEQDTQYRHLHLPVGS